ncbi:hypothetical protein [Haladaptatus cibarius]|uniref:hypothetical protein n=1 Tax=Haladaptatus cibarius TaxID=453847 RepID=UPI001B805172|nr:hypothetical protein [Haladaptatus cibarius]
MSTTEKLYLSYTDEKPSLEEYEIKHQEVGEFFGHEFTFTIIGDSHYIGCEALQFHEFLTCNPIQSDTTQPEPGENLRRSPHGMVNVVPITKGYTETLSHAIDDLDITVEFASEPLSSFSDPAEYDIAYQFGPEAYTSIDVLSEVCYETYHTYPEHGLALRSETRLDQ